MCEARDIYEHQLVGVVIAFQLDLCLDFDLAIEMHKSAWIQTIPFYPWLYFWGHLYFWKVNIHLVLTYFAAFNIFASRIALY